jgi:hypothetical protein
MNPDRQAIKDEACREIFTHIIDLRDRCNTLSGPYQDPIAVFNSLHSLKSILGQIESASERYRKYS